MKRINFLAACAVIFLLVFPHQGNAGVSFSTWKAVTCAVDGSSTEVITATASRASYLLVNNSAGAVRFAHKPTGTPDLTDSDSVLLSAGQSLSDSDDTVFVGRLVCMSNDATPRVIYVIETRKTG